MHSSPKDGFMSLEAGSRSAAGTDLIALEKKTKAPAMRSIGKSEGERLKMWAIIVALSSAVLSFAGAMWGVQINSKDLKQRLYQAHSDLKLQLQDESSNFERSINAQAGDLMQQLTFEGMRDKRTIYAAALAALKRFDIAGTDENETAARVAVSGVALVAPYHVWEAAKSTLDPLCRGPGTSTDRVSGFRDSWNQMVQAMRTDLGVNALPGR
jgi:hypothetical protein